MFLQMLGSVRGQSYDHIEHIIVDGASTDGTTELLKERGCNFISEPDRGIYDALNKGYKMAGGDYIGILNTDDFYHDPDGIKAVAAKLGETRPDYLYTGILIMEDDPEKPKIMSPLLNELLLRMALPHPGLFIKNNVVRELGYYDQNFKIAGDYDLTLRMFMSGKYTGVELPGQYMTYRMIGISSICLSETEEEVKMVYEKNYRPILPSGLDPEQISKNGSLPLALCLALWRKTAVPGNMILKYMMRESRRKFTRFRRRIKAALKALWKNQG